MKYKATISYIVLILFVNALFPYLPTYTLWGAVFSSGDITVGMIYILRDFTQREIGNNVLYAMIIGCTLSYALADKQLAIASIASFSVGEFIDWLFYTYTRKPLSQRLLISSLFSIPVDTVVFLYMISELNSAGFVVMGTAKTLGILSVWGFWKSRQKNSLQELTING
jgi:uncharacterized PurR-regulated membrane protein YhhQ (DUF165 family)